MERQALMNLDLYLNDPVHRITRVVDAKALDKIFDSKKTIVVNNNTPIAYETTKGKKRGAKALSAEQQHWLIDGLKSRLGGLTMLKAHHDLVAAMSNFVKKQPILDDLGKVLGGNLLHRTSWPWKVIESKSQHRAFSSIAQVALQEYVVIQIQRISMLRSHPKIVAMRRAIREIFEPSMRSKNTISRPDRFAATPIPWTWPDNIDDKDFASTSLHVRDDDDTMQANLNRQLQVLADHDRIMKIVQMIERSPLAAHSHGSKSIATEVRHALDNFIDVSLQHFWLRSPFSHVW